MLHAERKRHVSARPHTKRLPHKIRFTQTEWTRIVERARETGRSPARYVREVALGRVPRARRSQSNAELVRELGRIGNALVELARSCRSGAGDAGRPALLRPIEQTLTDVLEIVRRLP